MQPFLCIPFPAMDSILMLDDQERGRLLAAMVAYVQTGSSGADERIQGNERYIWPTVRGFLDAALRTRKSRATSGAAGGSKRKQTQANAVLLKQTEANENLLKQTEANGSKSKQNEFCLSKCKQTEANDDLLPPGEPSSDAVPSQLYAFQPDPPLLSESEAEASAAALNQVYDLAWRSGFPNNPATLDKLTALSAEFSPEEVMQAINIASENGSAKISYLRAVLKNRAALETEQKPPAVFTGTAEIPAGCETFTIPQCPGVKLYRCKVGGEHGHQAEG